jgi:hypothetical protein
MHDRHFKVKSAGPVRVVNGFERFAVGDGRFILGNRNKLLGGRFIVREIIGGKPVVGFLGLALGPDLRGAAGAVAVHKIQAFARLCGIFQTDRDQFAGRISLVQGDGQFFAGLFVGKRGPGRFELYGLKTHSGGVKAHGTEIIFQRFELNCDVPEIGFIRAVKTRTNYIVLNVVIPRTVLRKGRKGRNEKN